MDRKFSPCGWLFCLTLALITGWGTAVPTRAAEKLFFIYTPLNISLRIASLEAFAEDGTVDKNLEFFFNLPGVSEEEIAAFRRALTQRADIDPILLSRFLKTEIGEDILTRVGTIINIQGGRNGMYPIRGALVQAALDSEGLTLINFFKKLPVNIQIDLEKALELADAIELVVRGTEFANQTIQELSAQEVAATPPVNFAELADVRQPGPLGVEKQRWILTDAERQRRFHVDVYQPQPARSGKVPVVVISHGLGSRPEDFADPARHLASYGYVVALPQHPGSDSQLVEDLKTGLSREVFDRDEFINRPRDISFTLDELERRNVSQFGGRLDLDNVGVMGHSFGGYTALALAGATWDFEHLQRECSGELRLLNTALLLQCRALGLDPKTQNFRDGRVKAVLAVNPVNRSIFGPQGLGKIPIPVFVAAGTYDPATPLIFEQLRPFTWLTTPHKYLLSLEGQAHVDFSQLDAGVTEAINSVVKFTLPSPELLRSYTNGLVLAFFEVYVANNPDFRPYLKSAYADYISQGQEFKAHLIPAARSGELEGAIESFRQEKVNGKQGASYPTPVRSGQQ